MRQLLLYIILACGATVSAQTTTTIKLTQLETSPVIESSRAGQVGLTNSDGKQRYAQFVEVDLNPIGFVPTATGNTQNYSEFVTDPNGDKWYIDWQGRGYKFPGAAVDKNGYYGGNLGNGGNGTIPSSTTSTLTNQLTFLIDTSALTGTVPIRIKINKPGDFEDFMSMVSGSNDSLFFYRSDANFVIRYTSAGDFALVADNKLMLQGDSIQMVGVGTHTGGGSIFLKQTAGGTVKKQIGINSTDLNFSPVLDINAGSNVTVTDTNGVYTISATGGGGGGTYYPGQGIDITNDTISLDTVQRLSFRTNQTYSGGVGTFSWDDVDGTLQLGLKGGNVTLQVGQESVQLVKHADNTGLENGKVVYLTSSSGTNMEVRYAQANSEATSANTLGLMTETVTGGNKGFCTTFGLVRNINTSNLLEGGIVWLSKDTAGAMTAVRPTAPNHGTMIGLCVKKHATQGVIFVEVQNGYELNELHNVYAPAPTNNQGLLYKSANSRWEAAEVDTSLYNEGQLSLTSTISGLTIQSSTEVPGIGYTKVSFNDQAGIYLEKIGDIINVYNTGDLLDNNEGTLGVGAGTATSSVITSNTSGATGVTVSGGTGIAVTETTSSNGGTITVTNSAPDQTVSLTNGGGVGVTGTYPSFTLTATDQSITNELQTIDTFSLSGQSLRASLSSDNQPAKVVTLPVVGITAGTNVTVSESSGVYTINSSGGGAPTGAAGGDLSGTYPNPTVAKIQGVSVSTTAPTNGQVLSYSTASSSYVPASVSARPAGSSGQIQVNKNGVFGSNSNFFLDTSFTRLSIGNNNPQARLHINGIGSLTAKTVLIQNTASPSRSLLDISDNGQFLIGTNSNALATAPTAAIGVTSTETNVGLAIVPKGTGAITAQIPDGGTAGGNVRGNNAVDLQMSRTANTHVAAGNLSVICGGANNSAQSANSIVLGGSGNLSSGTRSITGGENCTASSADAIAIGSRCSSTNTTSVAIGYSNASTGSNTLATGYNARSYLLSMRSHSGGNFVASENASGAAQRSDIGAYRSITGTSAAELTLDGGTPAAGTRLILALPTGATAGRLWNAIVELSAICTTAGGTVTAGESFIGSYNVGIKRTSGGGTALVGTPQNLITPQADSNMSSSVVTISADTGNNALKIEYTPPTGSNESTVIRVVATVYLTEVGY